MKRPALFAPVLLLVPAILLPAASIPPRVSRSVLAGAERKMDQRVERITQQDPFSLLGFTRGVYIEGFGAVFTNEIDLLASAIPSPFTGRTYNAQDLARIKQRKRERIALLKESMRDMLIESAAALSGVAESEQIVIGVSIQYFRWEDAGGLPRQILVQAPKKALVEAAGGKLEALKLALREQEF